MAFHPFADARIIPDFKNDGHNLTGPSPVEHATTVDIISPDSPQLEVIKHVFPSSGPKSKPVKIDVNGRKDRRAICVVYGDGMRYEVLDMDAEMPEEDEDDEEEEDDQEN